MKLKWPVGIAIAGLLCISSGGSGQPVASEEKARLIIMADMGWDPDEEQQMVSWYVHTDHSGIEDT